MASTVRWKLVETFLEVFHNEMPQKHIYKFQHTIDSSNQDEVETGSSF